MLLQSARGHLPYPALFLPTVENPCFRFPALWEVIQPANCGQVLPLFVLSRCTVGKALCGLSPLTLSSTAPKQHCSRLNPTPHPSAHHSTDGISSLAANPFPVVEFLFSQSTSEKGEPPLLRSGQPCGPQQSHWGDGSQTKAAINPAQRLSHYCGLNGQGLCQNSVWLTDPADRGANAWAWPGCSFTSNGDALL